MFLQIDGFIKPDRYEAYVDRFKRDGVIPSNGRIQIARETSGIVEFEDGTVVEVEPAEIVFLDSGGRFKDFDFLH